MIALRDYQEECIAAIRRDWQAVDRTLAVLATGTGKTVIFLALLDELRQAGELGRALIIAHRRELIYQPIERAQQMFPDLAWGMGVVMADQDDIGARVVVATVQSLNSGNRLERILAAGPITHVVVDECHHVNAGTYTAVLDAIPGAKVLGVTATPHRTDGDGLSRVFQRCSFRMPIDTAIARGALVPFDALGVTLPVSFAGLKETEDGWELEGAGDVLSAQNALDIVLSKWRQFAGDRRTILFTASVAQAQRTAAHFAAQGIAAEWVSGETPKGERDRILGDYKAGKTQVICNCMVLTEGFDAPETGAVLMVAPTRSDLIYVQRLGRGLRTAPGKENCRVLDFVPLSSRNVIMAGDVLGTPVAVRQAQEKAEEAGIIGAWGINLRGQTAAIDPTMLVVKTLNLLRRTQLAWAVNGNLLTAALSGDAALCIVLPEATRIARAEAARHRGELFDMPQEDLFAFIRSVRLYVVCKEPDGWGWTAALRGTFERIEDAKRYADGISLELMDGTLGRRSSGWRKEPATEAQLRYMRRLGISAPENCSKGHAAQLITQTLTTRAVLMAERGRQAQILQGTAA